MANPLWQRSACDLAELISKGEVTSHEAVTSAVDRIQETNPHLNAIVDDLADAALKRASELDAAYVRSGPVGPLHGVPITIKENVDQAGRATPNGVTAFKDVIAPDDAPLVKNLEHAGAIVVGRTNTPEFSFRATTVNELHGRTRSPWNDWASSGGSSGGASTAVMSGMCALAHGNDIGGSLRYPAAATGAATVKPGLGRVPAYNPSQTEERGLVAQLMSVQGVIAREVADVRLGFRNMIGASAEDPWHVTAPFEGPSPDGPIKVAFTKNPHDRTLHPAVDRALDNARDALSDTGYQVFEVEPPNVLEIGNEGARTLFGEMKVLLGDTIRTHGSDTINQVFDYYHEIFPPFEGDDLIRAYARRTAYIRSWMRFLDQYPLVLTPFQISPTFAWNRDAESLEGAQEVLGDGFYSIAMNFLGLPAGNVSANYNDGLPVGVQIVGNRFREDLILNACEAIEDRIGIMADHLFRRGVARD